MSSKEVIKAEVVKEIKLTSEDKKIAKKIKSKLRKTAETIIEIGEELIKAIEEKPRGFKEVFYKEIGISDRSAQRYMQIANHVKVIELKENNELEGKTMTDLLQLITPDTSSKEGNIDTKKVASGFYSRYKDKPDTLKKIIKELQDMLEQSDKQITLLIVQGNFDIIVKEKIKEFLLKTLTLQINDDYFDKIVSFLEILPKKAVKIKEQEDEVELKKFKHEIESSMDDIKQKKKKKVRTVA